MTVVLRSSSLFLKLIAILSQTKVARVEGALRRGVVGRLRIGMTFRELKSTVQPAVLDGESEKTVTIYYGSNSGEQPTLKADITNGVVSQLRIFSQRFRTDIGIGVGATLTELSRFYRIAWSKPGLAYVDSLRMVFEIREGKIASILVS